MSWQAKPSGGYSIDSDEALANYKMVVDQLKSTWTLGAISGMLGNMYAESGMNPWRWQSDTVDYTAGYGLAQFTPASGYIEDYGVGVSGYAPNLSVSEATSGASASDGRAQITVINQDLAGKYIDRSGYCDYEDISEYSTISAFRGISDTWIAAVTWLFDYEFPADYSYSVAYARYNYAVTIQAQIADYYGGGGSSSSSKFFVIYRRRPRLRLRR